MTCHWTPDYSGDEVLWETECFEGFIFTRGGGPREMGFNFCPCCGNALVIVNVAPVKTVRRLWVVPKD